jgi:hypothetical protein
MTKTMLLTLSLLITGSAHAQGGSWEKIGATTPECDFQATFYRLKGFPFGRLEVSIQGKSETIPLVLQEEVHCKKAHYDTAYPRSLSIPTYAVEMRELCQGSLPKLSADIFLSGVTKNCRME